MTSCRARSDGQIVTKPSGVVLPTHGWMTTECRTNEVRALLDLSRSRAVNVASP